MDKIFDAYIMAMPNSTPRTFEETINSKESTDWKRAMENGIISLREMILGS